MDAARRKFARKMVAALRAEGFDGPLPLDEEQFTLDLGETTTFNLDNAFADWQRAPLWRRAATIRTYAAGASVTRATPPSSADEARPNLLLRVRDVAWRGLLELRTGQPLEVASRPLNEQLALEVVYDFPTAVKSVTLDELAGWGMDLDEAVRTARANLRDRTAGTLVAVRPGVYASPWRDNADATRIVLTELISRLDLRGDPVALIPHRDQLLVTGSDDEDGLGAVAELALPLVEDGRRVTGRAFAWRDGSWQPFVPPPGHPQRERFRLLAAITQRQDYDEQEQLLEERHEREGVELFVARVLLFEKEDTGRVLSVGTWSEGVPTLLPRTDAVSFVRPTAEEDRKLAGEAPWERVVEVMGAAMAAQGLVPERWLVETFPTDEQLEQLVA